MDLNDALWQDDERMSGAVCFGGTRVPISIMFEHLEAGRMEEFYRGYPNVSEDQVTAVLEASRHYIEDNFGRRASA
jgi:uncharacterized protein (DUF433 family)